MPEENIETTEPTNVDNSEISIEEPMEPGGDYTVKIDGAEHQVTSTRISTTSGLHS